MSDNLPFWPRPRFEPGGGDAFLFFAIYGQFSAAVELSGAEYRTTGVPEGLNLRKLSRATAPSFPFSGGSMVNVLHPRQPGLFTAIQDVPECMILQGTVADPPDLNYFRDAIGLITYFLDHGGMAVIDPQQFKLYDPAAWRTEVFEPQLTPEKHVEILWSEEPGNVKWFHTRGLRKFGRPDLSIHGVRPEQDPAVIGMLNRFIVLQAEGGRIPEGEEIRMESLPSGLACHHAGSLDDPDFNNVHVEIR